MTNNFALITGASQGLGRAFAFELAKRMATTFFPDLEMDKQKRIMLRFAKLQTMG